MESNLAETDLLEAIRKFETNRASGSYLSRVIKKTTQSYGPEYVIHLLKLILNSHQDFGVRANRVMIARYSGLFISKIYKTTKDEKFLEYLASLLTDNDARIRQDARITLSRIKMKEADVLLAEYDHLQ